MNDEQRKLIGAARYPCPKCSKKGLGYSAHAHARGYKDHSKLSCRYCRTVFKNPDYNRNHPTK